MGLSNYPDGVTDADFIEPERRRACWQCACYGRDSKGPACFADAILDDEPSCTPVGMDDDACDLFEER